MSLILLFMLALVSHFSSSRASPFVNNYSLSQNAEFLQLVQAVSLKLPYVTEHNETKIAVYDVPHEANVLQSESHLTAAEAILTIDAKSNIQLQTTFTSHNETFQWTQFHVSYETSDPKIFPNAIHENKTQTFKIGPTERTAAVSETYVCKTGFTIHHNNASLTASDIIAKPFKGNQQFGKTNVTCQEDPKPTPAPPGAGNWVVSDSDGTCIAFQGTILLNVHYQSTAGTKSASVGVPANAAVDRQSHCGADQRLVLDITNDGHVHTLELDFQLSPKNATKSTWSLNEIKFTADLTDNVTFPDADNKTASSHTYGGSPNVTDFVVPQGEYFACAPDVPHVVEPDFNITLKDVKFQAYLQNKTMTKAHHCKQDDMTNDLVPIIVGAALAALVVVVLVAYLIGRVRSKRSTGYESV